MDPIFDGAGNVYSYPSVSSYPADDNPSGVSLSLPTENTVTDSVVRQAQGILGAVINQQLAKDTAQTSADIQRKAATVQLNAAATQPVIGPGGTINKGALLQRAMTVLAVVGAIAGGAWLFKRLA